MTVKAQLEARKAELAEEVAKVEAALRELEPSDVPEPVVVTLGEPEPVATPAFEEDRRIEDETPKTPKRMEDFNQSEIEDWTHRETDVAELRTSRNAEVAGRNRKGVLKVIDARIAELSAPA